MVQVFHEIVVKLSAVIGFPPKIGLEENLFPSLLTCLLVDLRISPSAVTHVNLPIRPPYGMSSLFLTEGTEEQKGDRTIFKELMHKNIPNLMKIINRFRKAEEILRAGKKNLKKS